MNPETAELLIPTIVVIAIAPVAMCYNIFANVGVPGESHPRLSRSNWALFYSTGVALYGMSKVSIGLVGYRIHIAFLIICLAVSLYNFVTGYLGHKRQE